jgi:hypothetical protein
LSNDYPGARLFFNIVGGSLTLLSLQLPWIVVNGGFLISIRADALYQVAFYWILAGAILSFLSRFGGILTFIGLLAFAGEPYLSFGFSTAGQGLLLAIAGGTLSFAGARWAIPRTLDYKCSSRGNEKTTLSKCSVGQHSHVYRRLQKMISTNLMTLFTCQRLI